MTTNNRKEQWQQSFDKAITSIEQSLQSKPDDHAEEKEFSILANWLYDNQHNEYEYMTSGFENFTTNPFEFNSVLNIIHHALCDDGGISFVTMKLENQPIRIFMLFVDSNEDYFHTVCEKENKSLMDSYIKGRESLNRVKAKTKEKYPEREVSLLPTISKEDFVFEAHRDPVRFIKEIEEFKIYTDEKNKQFDEKMAEFRKKKM